jgi:hypothetical protein
MGQWFFWDKSLPFHYIKKVPSNNINGQGNFLEIFSKESSHFEEEKSYEIVIKFLKDVGRFLAFFFWNRHI